MKGLGTFIVPEIRETDGIIYLIDQDSLPSSTQ